MGKDKKIFFSILGVVILFNIINRLSFLRYVFAFPELRLVGPDSFYHLKRIIYTFENYPEMLMFDPFLSYPEGDFVPWPPLFDFIGGSLAKIIGNPIYSSVFLNFFVGLLTLLLILLYLSKRHITATIVSLSILAVSTLFVSSQSVGNIDHHALEVFLVLSFYLSFAYLENKIWKVIILSIIVTLSFFNWPGAPLYYGPVFLFNLVNMIKKEKNKFNWVNIAIPFFVSGSLIYLYLTFSGYNVFDYSYRFFSRFHVDFCFFVAFLSFAAILYGAKHIPKFIPLTLTVVIFIIFRGIFFEVFGGMGYLTKTAESQLMGLVSESQPLFFGNNRFFIDDFVRNLFFFSIFYLISPFIIYREIKKKNNELLFFALLYFFLLTFFQIRMGIFFVPFIAIFCGYLAFEYYKSGKTFIKKHIFLIVALINMIVMTIIWFRLGYENYDFGKHTIYETMNYLRENTKDKERFQRGEVPYGIFTAWDIGHYVVTLGNRPAIAHNFITNARNNKELEYIKAIYSKSEDEIVSLMDKNNTPYLIISNLYQYVANSWSLVYNSYNPYVTEYEDKVELNDNINDLFLNNLVFGGYPSKHLRIIFEADFKDNLHDYIAIVERVKGVKLVTKEKGVIIVNLKTKNGDLELSYNPENIGQKYIFTVPYSTDNKFDVIVDSVLFKNERGIKRLFISEGEVINGVERILF